MYKDNNNDFNDEKEKTTISSLNSNDIKKDNDNYTDTKIHQEHLINKTTDHNAEILLLFKEMYHQAIIESFNILGKEVSGVVINYLEEKHSLQLEDTVDNPLILDEVLEEAINGGSRIIERKIIKILSKKVKMKNNIIEFNGYNFADNISKLKKLYLERRVNT